jgi:hypothetical protein
MRPPRFRLLTLMIAVMAIGLLIGSAVQGDRLLKQSRYYRYWARMHGIAERRTLVMLARTEAEIARCTNPAAVHARWQRSGLSAADMKLFVRDARPLIRRASVQRREVAFHARMRKRFEETPWRPWLTVHREEMPD